MKKVSRQLRQASQRPNAEIVEGGAVHSALVTSRTDDEKICKLELRRALVSCMPSLIIRGSNMQSSTLDIRPKKPEFGPDFRLSGAQSQPNAQQFCSRVFRLFHPAWGFFRIQAVLGKNVILNAGAG